MRETATSLLFCFQDAKQFQALRTRLVSCQTAPSRKLRGPRESHQSRMGHGGTGSAVPPVMRRPPRRPSSRLSVHILAWMEILLTVRDNVPLNTEHHGLARPHLLQTAPTLDLCRYTP